MNQLIKEFQDGWLVPDYRPIYEWAKDTISLPAAYAVQGPFSISRSNYHKAVFDAIHDQRVREIVICAAVQTGKSLVNDIFIPWAVLNNPGNILLIQQDEDAIKKYSETRLSPLLNSINNLPFSKDRFDKQKTFIKFPHCSLVMGGANVGNLQSLSYKYFIGDELWLWKEGLLQEGKARTTAFPYSSKIILTSQASTEGDDFNNEWVKGDQAEYGFKCPVCGLEQQYVWTAQRADGSRYGVTWDKIKDDKGKYKIYETAQTARYNTVCNHDIADTPVNRRKLNDSGLFIPNNTSAPKEIRSFRWNALGCIDIKWSKLAEEFLFADQQCEFGYTEPLKEFLQKRLAEFWNPNLQYQVVKPVAGDYDKDAKWDGEFLRFMTIDCQANLSEFYYIIRAWNKNGDSRLIAHGSETSFLELEEIAKKHGVNHQCIGVDSGYETTRIYQHCVQWGHQGIQNGNKKWLCANALKGSEKENFLHLNYRTKVKDKRIYSPLGFGDPMLGKGKAVLKAPLYLWSNPSVKDILKRLKDNKAGCQWLITKEAENDPLYIDSLNSERKVRETNKKTGKETWIWKQIGTKPNHYWDAECMNIVMAAIGGCLNIGAKKP